MSGFYLFNNNYIINHHNSIKMLGTVIIIYAIGLIFTYFIDRSVVSEVWGEPITNPLIHYTTMVLIWVLSPLFMLGLLVVLIKHLIKKRRS